MNESTLGTLVVILAGLLVWLYLKFQKIQKEFDQANKERIRLLADNALLEAEHLKFQLQPHTINNILQNLKVIANKLNNGIVSFSNTLEYILYKGNKHLVTVENELLFIKQYIALNDLFISNIDSISIEESQVNRASKYYSIQCLPHLITAYFIENAFKHGDVTHKDFLQIRLVLTNTLFEMHVTNKVKENIITVAGGLGLNNMKKRLQLLLAGEYKIDSRIDEGKGEYISSIIIHFEK